MSIKIETEYESDAETNVFRKSVIAFIQKFTPNTYQLQIFVCSLALHND
jgi:hypothetical protein